MMTIKEYKEKHGFTARTLAYHLGVSASSTHRWLSGVPGNGESVEKLKKFGIDLPLRPYEVTGVRNKQKAVKQVEDPGDNFVTEVQRAIVNKYGNTIISRKYKAEDIVKEFAKHGMAVVVREFECKNEPGSETHYIVETLEKMKERVKRKKR